MRRGSSATKATVLVLAIGFGYIVARYTRGIVGISVILDVEEPDQTGFAVSMFDAVHDLFSSDPDSMRSRSELQ